MTHSRREEGTLILDMDARYQVWDSQYSASGVQSQTLEWLWLKRICFGVILLTGCPTRDRLWIPKTPYMWSCGMLALVGLCACCGGRPVRGQTDTPCWRLALELVMKWLVNNASQHRQLTLLLPERACSRARPAFACVRFNHHCALYLKRGNPLLGQSKWSILPYFILLQVEWFFFLIFIKIRDLPQNHNWFLSPLPVYFFWACALFAQGMQNLGLFWPILANLLRIYALLGVLLQGDGDPKLKNIRYAQNHFPQIGTGLVWGVPGIVVFVTVTFIFAIKRRIWIT